MVAGSCEHPPVCRLPLAAWLMLRALWVLATAGSLYRLYATGCLNALPVTVTVDSVGLWDDGRGRVTCSWVQGSTSIRPDSAAQGYVGTWSTCLRKERKFLRNTANKLWIIGKVGIRGRRA